MTQPRVLMERIPDQIAAQLVENAEASPFYRVFAELPESFPDEDQARLRALALETVEDTVPTPICPRAATASVCRSCPTAVNGTS